MSGNGENSVPAENSKAISSKPRRRIRKRGGRRHRSRLTTKKLLALPPVAVEEATLLQLEQRAQRVAKSIIDTILTLRCPKARCGQAFVDFVGCHTLTCHRCNTSFCGRCLKYKSWNHERVHNHVQVCEVFPSFGQQYQRERRRMLVIRRLKTQDRNTITRVLSIIDTNLREIGISISESDV